VINETISTAGSQPGTLLFVDDEPNILSALRRLFRSLGYRIFIAESGAAGLEVIATQKIDLVISDMRMPVMDGAQFLEQVRVKSPGSIRILLTGYADIESTIAAINKGQIYRYINKPWEDNDITTTVRHALERKYLEQEKERLEALTRRQNAELIELNASLEDKVKARTEELRQTMGLLETAHEKQKKSFITSIHVFSNLMELRQGAMSGHSRRVADLSRRLSSALGMGGTDIQEIMVAALLHDIGKIGLPDNLLRKSFSTLTKEERITVAKHPVVGQTALMALEQLNGSALLIRGHHERFDGRGFPDGLADFAIPYGSRILAVANDYDSLQRGHLMNRRLTPDEALSFIQQARGKRYDPQIVDAFVEMMGGSLKQDTERDIAIEPKDIKDGMVLSRDLLAKDGMLLLAKDNVLDSKLRIKLLNHQRVDGESIIVYVLKDPGV
jgi:response regulator RpfG family c-di-GMP phosphodiesterase